MVHNRPANHRRPAEGRGIPESGEKFSVESKLRIDDLQEQSQERIKLVAQVFLRFPTCCIAHLSSRQSAMEQYRLGH